MSLAPPSAHGLRATARIVATAAPGTTDLPLLRGEGPFNLYRTRSDGPEARVCIVGAMSAPHNGDRLVIEATAEQGATVHITSASATIALPGPTPTHATYEVVLTVGDDAELRWLPKPLISAAGSDLHQTTLVDLAPTARFVLREEQILGRMNEPAGHLTNRITVRRNGKPLLDQQTTSGPGTPGWDSPAILAGNQAIGQLLVVDPAFDAQPPPVHLLGDAVNGHGVLTPLAGPGALATAVASNALHLRRCLDTAMDHLARHHDRESGDEKR